jgi:hypothetical protein
MVLKIKKRIFSLLTLLIVINLSNELNVKKNMIKMIRNLQATITTPTSTSNSTEPSPIDSNPVKSSSSGLSKGAIIAIVLPCVAALIAVGALAALCRATPTPPIQPSLVNSSAVVDLNPKPPKQNIFFNQPVQPVTAIVQQPVEVVQEVQPVTVVQEVQPVAVVQEVPVQPVTVVQEVPVQPVTVVQEVPVQPVTVVQEVPVQPVTVVKDVPVA